MYIRGKRKEEKMLFKKIKRTAAFALVAALAIQGAAIGASAEGSNKGGGEPPVQEPVSEAVQEPYAAFGSSYAAALQEEQKKQGEQKAEKEKAKKKAKKKSSTPKKASKPSGKFEATYYTGSALGFRGAGGKLTCGESIALNNSQRKSLGIKYGDKLYADFPERHDKLDGWYEVKDTGCARGTADFFYASNSKVPPKFRREGRVKHVTLTKEAG
jgi:hypothetical protein